jgi:VWFA-related protein
MMKLKMTKANSRASILFTLIAITANLIYSQNQRQVSDQPIKLNAELVVLDIQVVNKKTGHVVGNLKKDDFLVYEDGVKQQITHFSQGELPLSIVLLLDLSASVRPVIKQIRDGALRALQRLKPEDEIAIMVFANKAKLIQDFSKDRELIVDQIEKIKELRAEIGGGTFLNDGIYHATAHMRKSSNPNGRRVIIAITDNVSTQPFFIGHSAKEILHELFEHGIVICGVLVDSWLSKAQRATIWNRLLRKGNIKKYADETGGVVLNAKKEDVESQFGQLIDQLRTRYTLAYMPSNQKLDGKFRKIKVEISPEVEKREGKLAVLARRGYYARRSDAAATTPR